MTIAKNLEDVRRAMLSAGGENVTLIAVSKRHSIDAIKRAYEAGQRDFGENYVQELVEKRNALHGYRDIRFHFIGTVQSNKISALNDNSHMIHGACSAKHIAKIKVDVLAQVNVGNEPQKKGFLLSELSDFISAFAPQSTQARLRGLMAIPPAANAANYFTKMREAFDLHRQKIGSTFDVLSMGMSADFQQAIRAGSTHIRVGTAIFGSRE